MKTNFVMPLNLKYPLFLALFLLLLSCNNPSVRLVSLDNAPVVAQRILIDGEELIDLNPSLLKDTLIFPLSQFAEELVIVKLDDREEALVTPTPSVVISENYMLIIQTNTPAKLFDKHGKYIADVGSRGQGPGEYQNISSVKIDEKAGRIYILTWRAKALFAYDLQGVYKESIPLVYEVRKGTFTIVDDKLLILSVPTDPVWVQDLKGELLYDIPSAYLDIRFDFSNHAFSDGNTSAVDYNFWIWKTKLDTLYHVDLERQRLIPRFTASFSPEKLAPHFYQEWGDYYLGSTSTIVTVAQYDDEGKIVMRKEGDPPSYYIVDKRSLKGSYFGLINDYFGDERIEDPLIFRNGYYIQNMDPGDLAERIEKLLGKSDLSAEMKKKLSDLLENISPDDNNYILYVKMKK